jgi:disulfide bond formation protein DsbB
MPAYVEIVNKILALGTIILQVVILLLLVNLIFIRHKNNKILLFFKKNTFHFGFIVALLSLLVSLFYSNVVGFPVCELCWLQRIFLYPQTILFGMILRKRDRSIINFSIIFAILGSLSSIYHVYIENGGTGISCAVPTSSSVISCAIRYVYEFGYITIPIMSLTVSLFVIAILANYKYMSKMN